MSTTKPIIEFVEPFTVTGFSIHTQNKDEFNPHTAKIPALWQQFYSSDLAKHMPVFGVYSDYASDCNDFYMLTVGIMDTIESADFNQIAIPAGHYLVFKATGAMPMTLIELWQQIWRYFETEKTYQRLYLSDFECYSQPNQVAIYIGIIPPENPSLM